MMTFEERLKSLRKDKGLSQEELADLLGVSRQAVTKWETGKGMPDIGNLVVLAQTFRISLDELLTEVITEKKPNLFISESVYDVDEPDHFDLNLGRIDALTVTTGQEEKLRVTLESDQEGVGSLYKIKFDENKNRLDVTCVAKNKTEKLQARDLSVTLSLPEKLADRCEISASCPKLTLDKLNLRRLEYDGDAKQIFILHCKGRVELTGKSDYEITTSGHEGEIDVFQWKAKTVVHLTGSELPHLVNKGRKCRVGALRDGKEVNYQPNTTSFTISASGISSELLLDLPTGR